MATVGTQILLVEDSPEAQIAVRQALSGMPIQLSLASNLAEARKVLAGGNVSLLLLDLFLPDGNGLELLEAIPISLPVFLLTGNEDTNTKVKAFGLGADDYLTKPVNPNELRARVEMRLRKVANASPGSSIRAEDLTVDFAAMKAFRTLSGKREDLDLTTKELKILSTLMKNRGRVLSRSEIVKEVWGSTVHVLDRTVDSHIAGLRRKLREAASYVESLPQQGYRFRPEKF